MGISMLVLGLDLVYLAIIYLDASTLRSLLSIICIYALLVYVPFLARLEFLSANFCLSIICIYALLVYVSLF